MLMCPFSPAVPAGRPFTVVTLTESARMPGPGPLLNAALRLGCGTSSKLSLGTVLSRGTSKQYTVTELQV